MVCVSHGQEAAQVSTVLPFSFKNSVQLFVHLCVFSPVRLLLSLDHMLSEVLSLLPLPALRKLCQAWDC